VDKIMPGAAGAITEGNGIYSAMQNKTRGIVLTIPLALSYKQVVYCTDSF
jgi:hypothetical protein